MDQIELEEYKKKETFKEWVLRQIRERVPITVWLPKYNWKSNIVHDLISGFAVGFLYITQGLAFAFLAHAPPIYGLYTCIFPVFIYAFLGTTVVSSVGPVSIPSMLTGSIVTSYTQFLNTEIISCLAFLIGLYLMIAFIFKLEILIEIFTKPLASAFFLAAGAKIFTHALIGILGLDNNITLPVGYFPLILTIYEIGTHISQTNFVTLAFSTIILTLMFAHSLFLRPSMKRYIAFDIPVEAILMIIGTIVSYLLNLKGHNVMVLGTLPDGFPHPSLPVLKPLGTIFSPSIVITLIIFFLSFSFFLMYNAEVDTRQELLVFSICNFVASCFHCLPVGNGIMRTVFVQAAGCKSLLSNIVSAGFVLTCLLWAGPLLAPLPTCILSCIVLTGVISVICKSLTDIPLIILSGMEDTMIWAVTLCMCLSLSIQSGMFFGLLLSLRKILGIYVKRDIINLKKSAVPIQ